MRNDWLQLVLAGVRVRLPALLPMGWASLYARVDLDSLPYHVQHEEERVVRAGRFRS